LRNWRLGPKNLTLLAARAGVSGWSSSGISPIVVRKKERQVPGTVLKRFLSILRDLILDSSVDRGVPNFAAAPRDPETRPRLSFRAASIMSFSCAKSVSESSLWLFDSARTGSCGRQLSSIEKIYVSQSVTERSMTFCSFTYSPMHSHGYGCKLGRKGDKLDPPGFASTRTCERYTTSTPI
jgi:hypothetical protein